jgi:replicative superfamily II helicase
LCRYAAGVNLPAYLCVVRGTRQYAGGGQGCHSRVSDCLHGPYAY